MLGNGGSHIGGGGGVRASPGIAGPHTSRGDVLTAPGSESRALREIGILDDPMTDKRKKWDNLDAFYGDDDDGDDESEEAGDAETETEYEDEDEDEQEGGDGDDDEEDEVGNLNRPGHRAVGTDEARGRSSRVDDSRDT